MTTAGDSGMVLLSGGQDSTVCLAWALERHQRVETIGFDYGQRHGVELQAGQACTFEARSARSVGARDLAEILLP